MRKILVLFAFVSLGLALDLGDVFAPNASAGSFAGKRVSISGTIDAKGDCETTCKIRVKARVRGFDVFIYLHYSEKYAPAIRRKWVSNVVVSSCVFENFFTYSDCIH